MFRNLSLLFIIAIAAIFGILSSYNISVISGVLLFLEKDFIMTLFDKQALVSVLLIGAMVGVFFSGILADYFGRKWTLITAAAFYLVSAIISVLAHSLEMIIVSRLLSGIGVGISSVVIPLYLAEVSPRKFRGGIVSLYQLAVTIGILVSYFVNYLLAGSQDWRISFGVGLIMTVVTSIGLFFIPESPRWLILHKYNEKAKKVLGLIGEEEEEQVEIKRSVTKDEKKKEHIHFRHLFQKKGLSLALTIGVLLSIFQQITGINAVIYYGPTIFRVVGLGSLSVELLATLGIGIINVIATIFAIWWIDKFGRRMMLMVGLAGMTLSLIALTLFMDFGLIAVISLMSYVVFFAISLGPIVWVVVSEIFPMRFRGKAISIATFVNWFSNYLLAFSFLSLINLLGREYVFLLFAVISVIAFFFVYFFVPETKGKSLEEIQSSWYKEE